MLTRLKHIPPANPVPLASKKMGKCPSKACLCTSLCLWLFTSICLLICTSILYLQPFIKVLRYQKASCRVEAHFFTMQYVCPCGFSCKSSYPCVVVHVSLLNVTKEGHLCVVTLYDDDTQQADVINAEDDLMERCSIKVCHENADKNRIEIDSFSENFGHMGHVLDCFYDPQDTESGAVLKILNDGHAAFHAVFWPGLSIVFGLLFCIVFCKRCGQIERGKELRRIEEAKRMADKPVDWKKLKSGDGKFPKTHKQRSLRSLWL